MTLPLLEGQCFCCGGFGQGGTDDKPMVCQHCGDDVHCCEICETCAGLICGYCGQVGDKCEGLNGCAEAKYKCEFCGGETCKDNDDGERTCPERTWKNRA